MKSVSSVVTIPSVDLQQYEPRQSDSKAMFSTAAATIAPDKNICVITFIIGEQRRWYYEDQKKWPYLKCNEVCIFHPLPHPYFII